MYSNRTIFSGHLGPSHNTYLLPQREGLKTSDNVDVIVFVSWGHDNLEDMRHLRQSDEAPISERCDDQSLLAADELILVL